MHNKGVVICIYYSCLSLPRDQINGLSSRYNTYVYSPIKSALREMDLAALRL